MVFPMYFSAHFSEVVHVCGGANMDYRRVCRKDHHSHASIHVTLADNVQVLAEFLSITEINSVKVNRKRKPCIGNPRVLIKLHKQVKLVQANWARVRSVQDSLAQVRSVQDSLAQVRSVQDSLALLRPVQDSLALVRLVRVKSGPVRQEVNYFQSYFAPLSSLPPCI
jgi:hypothetical protein